MTSVMKCRACFLYLNKANSLSIDNIGWESSTFQEMFETSIGYQILPLEPQFFCDLCVQKLIEWYHFKSVCQRTQEALSLAGINEIQEGCFVEEDEKKKNIVDIKVEPEQFLEKPEEKVQQIKTMQTENFLPIFESLSEPIEVKFNANIRCLGDRKQIGDLIIKGSSAEEFLHMIWLYIWPHIKQEIIIKNDTIAVWQKRNPEESDILKFVSFYDRIAKKQPKILNLDKFKMWVGRDVLLFIYPYSKNIQTRAHICAAKELIAKKEKVNLLPQNLSSEKNVQVSSDTLVKNNIKKGKPKKNSSLQCPFPDCKSILANSGSLHQHTLRCQHNPNREFIYKCTYEKCGRTYPEVYSLNRHIKRCRYRPEQEKLAQRKQCPLCSRMVFSVRNHYVMFHETGKFVCEICGVEKSTKGAFIGHFKNYHNEKRITFKCDKCPMEYRNKNNLQSHKEREHPETSSIDLKYKCEGCSYQTYNRVNFKRHMKIHHDPSFKRVFCLKCEKSFLTENLMKLHLQTHDETTLFACTMCDHVCKTKIALKAHMTLHEEWKYKCPVCQLKRRSSSEVRMHMKRKHPDHELPPKFMILKESMRKGQILKFTQNDDDGE